MPDGTPAKLTLARRLAYGLTVALCSVILAVCALEGFLRLVGFGHPTKFYREEQGEDGRVYYRENRWFVAPYFSPELIRRPQPMRIEKEKPQNCYRIFILGSSAAMGDPEASYSMARALEKMLAKEYTDIRFEVVNAAITAINSTVVRSIAADCAELKPDLFIVYEGNNEVIGPFGPSAVFAPFMASPHAISLVVGLRRTRTGQLLSTLAHSLGKDRVHREEWGGMEMFLDRRFANDNPALEDVRALFANNLRAIAKAGEDAGARTILCTVLTNRRDFAPFLSMHKEGLSAHELELWEKSVKEGDAAMNANRTATARICYREAWTIDSSFADLAFKMGRLELADGNDAEAARYLDLALDLDTLRFRTDSRLNDTVRRLTKEMPEACSLVDLDAVARTESPHGIPGDDLLYEHVHLNMSGTYLVARELCREVTRDLARRKIAGSPSAPASIDELREKLAYTAYDQAMIIQQLLGRFMGPPFTGQMDHTARLATWKRRAESTLSLMHQPGFNKAVRDAYKLALQESPDDWVLLRNFGMALVAQNDAIAALPLLENAAGVINDDPDTLFALATAQKMTGHDEQARETFAQLRHIEPRYPGLPTEP
jgi:tetratricopeptide (TPR) repeat protein